MILAEEWHTVDAVLHLDWLLRRIGLRDKVDILWNANNTFGFDRIDWQRLKSAAIITTVSRYMKHRMQYLGVQAVVIPNGLASDAFLDPVSIAITTASGTTTTLITPTGKSYVKTVQVKDKPTKIDFDPKNTLLKEVNVDGGG